MKVYVIEAERNAENSKPFVWNVYSSMDKALFVLRGLKQQHSEYLYYISEFDVIE